MQALSDKALNCSRPEKKPQRLVLHVHRRSFVRGPVLNPNLFFGEKFMTILAARGLQISTVIQLFFYLIYFALAPKMYRRGWLVYFYGVIIFKVAGGGGGYFENFLRENNLNNLLRSL